MRLNYETVGPRYFQTMRIPLVDGRDFSDRDDEQTAGAAIINETMAQRFWAGRSALGGRIKLGEGEECLTVVGIAKDGKYRHVNEPPQPFVYLPLLQDYRDSVAPEDAGMQRCTFPARLHRP
ncbi:MAG: hypothetical protein GEU99_13070 [Luteitalea sp.]|nr:hypothetical protein [Luteitalea sp.]